MDNLSLNITEQSFFDYLTTESFKVVSNFSTRIDTITPSITDDIEPKNFKPIIAHRLKKIAATAGKILRFKIPENTFSDVEDGSTSHLNLNFKNLDETPIPTNSWIKFDRKNQELLAM